MIIVSVIVTNVDMTVYIAHVNVDFERAAIAIVSWIISPVVRDTQR